MPTRSRPRRPYRPTTASQEQAPTPFPLLVRTEAMTVETWLRQVAAYRPQRPIETRIEALLWSWPIRRAITPRAPKSLWTCKDDDEETLERKAAVLTRIDSLAGGWYPYESPSQIHDFDFKNACRDICGQLRELPDVPVPDPGDDPLWLATLIETHWGDGKYDYRRDAQREVMARLKPAMRRQVCEIGERARDAAYLSVRTTRLLDALRRTKKSVEQFIPWLDDAKSHAPFIEEHLACGPEPQTDSLMWLYREDLLAFSAAFQVVIAKQKRVTDYLEEAFDSLRKDTGRDRRTKAGKPSCPCVTQADRALKSLKLPPLDRRDLLMAWGLKPLA